MAVRLTNASTSDRGMEYVVSMGKNDIIPWWSPMQKLVSTGDGRLPLLSASIPSWLHKKFDSSGENRKLGLESNRSGFATLALPVKTNGSHSNDRRNRPTRAVPKVKLSNEQESHLRV
ncbi:hypothetical protein H103_02314 [Trichophyton rubrum CBS 288.86]|uniref:Uncharacterized protein n=1 Tax=Trichophyton rubrum CBS 288.86 TaxID=1215330 RepID=A0A022W9S5_TRIRU|nr:hypothetical protein H103_02314 [Trichophyton rubrum CBS 288.86]EZF65661.1 hypothetical protein H104_02287 [Trichophyton rubrum CBS 289.86]EZG19318.1 hypothetical protein H107_02382 [Trichophyton rubrum CBS 202.88]